jgi:hypothetical protein
MLRQERDVDDADLRRAAMDVEPAGRLPVDEEDIEARSRVVLAPPGVLRLELLPQKGVLLRVVPRNDRELLCPRTRVDAVEELAVARLGRA